MVDSFSIYNNNIVLPWIASVANVSNIGHHLTLFVEFSWSQKNKLDLAKSKY
jgi:hypothetical protein